MTDTNTTQHKVKIPKLNRPARTWEFSLSMPGMISAVGAGVLALTFFFVMGILIGRGYRPEADVPPLSGIMPGSEHGQLAEEQAQEKPTILQAEELEYPERLKASPATIMDDQDTPSAQTPKPAPKAEARPVPVQTATALPTAARPETAQAAPGEPVFDYIYQVASFRKVDMAQALADKLSAAGLHARVDSGEAKGSTWHRVHVLHHGTPASTDTMKAVLSGFGINKPLLKSKKAAS
jgi:cell division septation protein DedD